MDKITNEVLNEIEEEYNQSKFQSVVGHGLYTVKRIRRKILERENLTKHNSSSKKDCQLHPCTYTISSTCRNKGKFKNCPYQSSPS